MLASDPNYVQSIKIHSFPLTSQLSDLTGIVSDQEATITNGEEFDDETVPKIPFVERNPQSEVTETYSRLCDDILSEIFKIQLSSQLVRTSLSLLLTFASLSCPKCLMWKERRKSS
jgi:hypothetical protein